MNSKILAIVIGFVIVGSVVAAILLQQNQNMQETSTNSVFNTTNSNVSRDDTDTNTMDEQITEQNTIEGITRATVSANNTISSCYIIYSGKVYRIPSDFANQHPGGRTEITGSCGKDITNNFNQAPHDFSAKNMLDTFYIGELLD